MKKHRVFPIALICFGTFTAIGFGNWLIPGILKTNAFSFSPYVCHIGSKYYTTINDAIKESVSGNSIDVIPGNKDRNCNAYTIKKADDSTDNSITIPKGVVLNIPYAEGVTNKKIADGSTEVHAFSDRNQYCQSSVIVADGVTLINKGTIEIGGILGARSGGPNGCTAGNYSELILGKNSKLINYDKLNVYGYLGEKSKGTASLLIKPSSDPDLNNIKPTMYRPLYWYDFGGGSALKAIYDAIGSRYCRPIDDFYFENVTPKTTIYGGADVISWTNIYAASHNGEYDLKLIGSDSSGIINLPKNSYLTSDYDEDTLINKLHFYGDASFNALSINVKKAITDTAGAIAWGVAALAGIPSDVTSNSGYFPVSFHYDITLDKAPQKSTAVFDGSSNRYKFLNGSSLKICEGVGLKVGALVAYKGDDYYSGRGKLAENLQKSKKPLIPANMAIDGQVSGDLIAGTFDTTTSGSFIIAKNNSSVTMYEPKAGSGSTTSAKRLDNEEGWFYLPISLKLINSSGQYEEKTNGNYISQDDSYHHWEDIKITIQEMNGKYQSDKRTAATFNISVNYTPSNAMAKITKWEWKQKRHDTNVSDDGTFESSNMTSTIFKTRANENWRKDNQIDVWLEVYRSDSSVPMTSNVLTFNATHRFGV